MKNFTVDVCRTQKSKIRVEAETVEEALNRAEAMMSEIDTWETEDPRITAYSVIEAAPYNKDKLFIDLVNAKEHKEELRLVPHTDIADLAIIYCVRGDDGGVDHVVDNSEFLKWGITLKELHECALGNSARIRPPMIGDMGVFKVVSVKEFTHGAAAIFYPEVAKALEGQSVYVIPSSIHEMLVMEDMGITAAELTSMVRMVNGEAVSPEERLSDHAYHFKDGIFESAEDYEEREKGA